MEAKQPQWMFRPQHQLSDVAASVKGRPRRFSVGSDQTSASSLETDTSTRRDVYVRRETTLKFVAKDTRWSHITTDKLI